MLKLKKVLSLALAGGILFPAVAFADKSTNAVNVESSEVVSVEDKIEQANKRWLELGFALRCTNEDEASIKLKVELEERRRSCTLDDLESVEILEECNETLEKTIVRLVREYGLRKNMLGIKSKLTCVSLLSSILVKYEK